VTLITGASTGIGAELARVFASNGHRLALVDRRGDRLQALATEMVAAGGAAPILIACDLEQSDACDKIAGALAAERVEVEFVVNNAGFGLFGYANELDRAEQLGIIAVNIVALTDLSLRFADSLVRHRGGILNLGSLAGFLPGPGWPCTTRPRLTSCRSAKRSEMNSVRAECASRRSVPAQSNRNFRPGPGSNRDLSMRS